MLSGDLKDLLDMVPDGLEYSFVGTFMLDSKKEKGSIEWNYEKTNFEIILSVFLNFFFRGGFAVSHRSNK